MPTNPVTNAPNNYVVVDSKKESTRNELPKLSDANRFCRSAMEAILNDPEVEEWLAKAPAKAARAKIPGSISSSKAILDNPETEDWLSKTNQKAEKLISNCPVGNDRDEQGRRELGGEDTPQDLEAPPCPPLQLSSEDVPDVPSQEDPTTLLSSHASSPPPGRRVSDSNLVEARLVSEEHRKVLTQAQQVDPTQLERRASREQKARLCQRTWYVLIAISLVILAIGLGVGLGTKKHKISTGSPTLSPTEIPSSAPTGILENLLQELPKSTADSINIAGTPQQQAYSWLANNKNVTSLPEWRAKQMFALAAFFYAFEGPKWPGGVNADWLDEDKDECTWLNTPLDQMYGLSHLYLKSTDFDFRQCNDAGEVQTIFLLNLDLSNAKPFVPPELALLSELKVLTLLASGLGGLLSDMLPSELVQLTKLDALVVTSNAISGTIASDIGLMTSLRYLLLSNNPLTGSIPTTLGMLTNIRQLDLSVTKLSGTIPRELGSMTRITDLQLRMNSHTGAIPRELALMTNLKTLEINGNFLSGKIPSELGLMSSLDYIFLQESLLSGHIPTELGNLSSLVLLIQSSNSLSGSIPSELGLLSLCIGLSLHHNSLDGSIPTELGLMTSLEWLWLSGNNALSGLIPSEFGLLGELRELTLMNVSAAHGELPQEMSELTNLGYFDISGCPGFLGNIPEEFCYLQNASCAYLLAESGPDLRECSLSFDCSASLCGCDCPCSTASAVARTPPETLPASNATNGV